jgi:methylated-DNA-[protein]-cysteine S-methyltransferase
MRDMTICESPIGRIAIYASDRGISELSFVKDSERFDEPAGAPSNKFLKTCRAQIEEYFSGGRTSFDVALDLKGTPFQETVWRALLLIPCGSTWSYGRLAAQVGRPKAARAVGGANHNNPVSIIVPCHRVVGGDGKLTGYGGGLWRKEWLLAHESKMRL